MAINKVSGVLDETNTLIVVPAYNEEKSVGGVVHLLKARGYQCLVVNDGSSDDTATIARTAGALVLSLPVNLGVGAALRAGFRFAEQNGFSAAIQFDADGQHDAEFIESLIQLANKSDFDLIIGSRFTESGSRYQISIIRLTMIKVLARIASWISRTKISDPTSGFRLVRGELLVLFSRDLPSHYLGDTFEALILCSRKGFKVGEQPTLMHQRAYGVSSTSPWGASAKVIRVLVSILLNIQLVGLTRRQ